MMLFMIFQYGKFGSYPVIINRFQIHNGKMSYKLKSYSKIKNMDCFALTFGRR